MFGGGGVTATTDSYSGQYAIRLTTKVDLDGDTVPAYLSVHPEIWDEGLTITGTPDSLVGYFKCNIMPDDTARIYIYAETGMVYGGISFTQEENSDDYRRFAMPMHVEGTDLIQLVLNSSQRNWDEAIPGSWIQFDSLWLKGDGLNPGDTLGNNDFERWADPHSYSYKEPLDWSTTNPVSEMVADTSFVFPSEDAHSGAYSISLISDTVPGQPLDGGEPVNYLSNGNFYGDAPSGGLITNQWPDSIVAYCKYSPVASDAALFAVINGSTDLSRELPTPQNSVVEILPEMGSFQKVVFDMTAITTDTSDPDSVLIIVSSSNILSGSYEIGSQLWIDDISVYPQKVNAIQVTAAEEQNEIYVDSVLHMYSEVFPDYALNDTVEWSVDDETIATIDQNGLLTGVLEGTVTVTATSTDGTAVEGTMDITVSAVVSNINKSINHRDITIYPVPAKSVIHIESRQEMNGMIQFMDISGKTVMETAVDKTTSKAIDISGLQSGVYFIRIESGDHVNARKLIIK
ncbi:MAG: T9SS type A sorting domain-containing protein [Bacteroidales bacterium]